MTNHSLSEDISVRRVLSLTALLLVAVALPLEAQQAPPTQGGQSAFAAVAEIVRLLEADRTTDWSKVDLEALRQHLIDMDAVTLRTRVRQTPTAGGLVMEITGEPDVAASV